VTSRPSRARRAATHAALLLACAAALGPAISVLHLALAAPGGGLSLENFRAVVSTRDAAGRPLFLRQLANSLVVAGATTAIAIAAATSAAYAFSRFEFPGKRGGLRLFLVSQMFPAVVSAVPLYILLDRLGLVDRLAGLVLVYATSAVPFSIWMLKGFFDQVPRELEEAARLEGASRFFVFRRVALPLVRPGIAVTALFAFMSAWNEFILAATFLNGEARYTLPVVLEAYVTPYGARWGLFAAGAVLVSLPVVLLFYVLQRNLVQGLVAGSVKG
jgi:arabinogalactan oligomer/maltooligosaccharide transport system permease protein